MKKTLKLLSLILALSLAFTLSSCEILESFLAADNTGTNESGGEAGDSTGNDSESGKPTAPSDKEESNGSTNDDPKDDNDEMLPGGNDNVPEGGSNDNVPGGGSNDNVPGGGSNDNVPGGGNDNVPSGGNDDDSSDDDPTDCAHLYANNICIYCSKSYVSDENANNCTHNWSDKYCTTCGARCDHKFDTTTCEYCGYVSGGIDNPINIHFEGAEIPVPYSATFFDVVALYMTFDTDVEMSFINNEWAEDIDGERRTVGMYETPADYGRDVWLVYLGNSNPGGDGYPGGDTGSNPAIVYIISVIDDPAYVPFTIESDTPLSGEDIIQRAGITNPECFYIYVNNSELYDLDSFRLMIFTETTNIDFHLAVTE